MTQPDGPEVASQLVIIEEAWAGLREESPSLSSTVWRRIEREVKFGQPLYGDATQTT